MKRKEIRIDGREWRYDALRIVMSFLVVLLHVASYHVDVNGGMSPFLYNTMGRLAVPVFFMVTGAISIPRVETGRSTLRRMVRRVLVPLALAAVGYAALRWVAQGESFFMIIWQSACAAPYYHLPFMYELAMLYCLLPLLQAAWRGMSHRCRIVLPFAILLLMELRVAGAFIPLARNDYFLVYALTGAALDELMKDNRQGLFKPAWWKTLLLAGVAIACLVATGLRVRSASMAAGMLVERGWEYVMPLIAVAAIACYIAFWTMPDPIPLRLRRSLAAVNSTTLGIYLWHPALILIMVSTWHIGGHVLSFPWKAGRPAVIIPVEAVAIWLLSGAAAALCGSIGKGFGRLARLWKEENHGARA